jgi:AAA ATPase domain
LALTNFSNFWGEAVLDTDEAKGTKELGFSSNKDVPIKSILGIDISKFRTLERQSVKLGERVTVLSGRNGTMKTSIMGLIAHPFDSDSKDAFGSPLKTALKEVFKLSPRFDNGRYTYGVVLDTPAGMLREEVAIYWVGDNTNRHRVVVSGAEKGDGNFAYNTSFLNLKRLFPLVHTSAVPDDEGGVVLNAVELAGLKDFYESVFPSSEYGGFDPIHQKKVKTTFAPSGDKATYDWHSISSGEDNLGAIYNRMLGFQRSCDSRSDFGNGILCLDEFESSLHPVAQLRLFDYLYSWSQKYRVQVVISTHSLHLIQHIYLKHQGNMDAGRVAVNFLSKSQAKGKNIPVLHNPPYSLAFKELTLEKPEVAVAARRVKVLCEDDLAIHFVKRLISSQHILKAVDFHSSLAPSSERPGTSFGALADLCIQYPLLLDGAFVVFDADVPDAQLSKIVDKNLYVRLPDERALAIERRIIRYIVGLDNGDDFFKYFDREREEFLYEFKAVGIRSLTPDDIENQEVVPIRQCKQWAEKNKADFKKYVTYYAKTIQGRDVFVGDFLARLNVINSSRGLPVVDLKG